MDQRTPTVLFADVSESTRLYESMGDVVASEAMRKCLGEMRTRTESSGGRVVKTIGDEVMALFGSADAAASAAAEMQAAIDNLPVVGEFKLGLRIGFHCGPVVQRDNDVFGDTVNLAARLVAQAVKGQIITSGETAGKLSPMFRSSLRRLYSITVKGKASEVELTELLWQQSEDMTMIGGLPTASAASAGGRLRLRYRGAEIARRRDNDTITLGRDAAAELVVAEPMASRQHCTIERRQGKFILSDHSTNGTFVTIEGDSEILLRRESLTLRKHGWITLGQTRSQTEEVVEYFCEE